ncbi:hypothetical protein C3L33_00599, partial [Rhododendron williamsianum]
MPEHAPPARARASSIFTRAEMCELLREEGEEIRGVVVWLNSISDLVESHGITGNIMNLICYRLLQHSITGNISEVVISSTTRLLLGKEKVLEDRNVGNLKVNVTRVLENNSALYENFWDLSNAEYGSGPEPISLFYFMVLVDSELSLQLGDMEAESELKRVVSGYPVGKSSFGDRVLYDQGEEFDLGEEVERGGNFRGNQSIFVDGLVVDLMWDVHDWLFNQKSGIGVFMFRTRSGLDSRDPSGEGFRSLQSEVMEMNDLWLPANGVNRLGLVW